MFRCVLAPKPLKVVLYMLVQVCNLNHSVCQLWQSSKSIRQTPLLYFWINRSLYL